jgi:hypothetical protein
MRFIVDRSKFFSEFLKFSAANLYSTIGPLLGCVTALTRHHIVTSPVFKIGASSLTQHVVDYRGRKLGG